MYFSLSRSKGNYVLRRQRSASLTDFITHSGIAKLNLFLFYFFSDLSCWPAAFRVTLERCQPLELNQAVAGTASTPAEVLIPGTWHLHKWSLVSCM